MKCALPLGTGHHWESGAVEKNLPVIRTMRRRLRLPEPVNLLRSRLAFIQRKQIGAANRCVGEVVHEKYWPSRPRRVDPAAVNEVVDRIVGDDYEEV